MGINLHDKLKQGYVWTSFIGLMLLPLTQYRNWSLARIDGSGVILGQYAIALLFLQAVQAFAVMGGSGSISYFLAQRRRSYSDKEFLMYFIRLSIQFALVLTCIFVLFPSLIDLLVQKKLSDGMRYLLISIVPLAGFSLVFNYFLIAKMDFKFSVIINNIQIFWVSILSSVALLFFSGYVCKKPLLCISSAVISALSLQIVVQVYRLRSYFSFGGLWRGRSPTGFWRYSLPVYLNSILMFVYTSSGQVVVYSSAGVSTLAGFFSALQLSQLVAFVSTKTMPVSVSIFSHAIESDVKGEFEGLLSKTFHVVCGVGFYISLVLMVFSDEILAVFGHGFIQYSWCLRVLVFFRCVAVMGPVLNSVMLAKGNSKQLAAINISVVLVQLLCIYVFRQMHFSALTSVIIAISISFCWGQLALFSGSLSDLGKNFKLKLLLKFSVVIALLLPMFAFEFFVASVFAKFTLMAIVALAFLLIFGWPTLRKSGATFTAV